MKFFYLVLWVVCWGCCFKNAPLLAQQHIAIVQKIGVADGLSSENITQLIQDSRGFIWAGTTNGLNRYDGVEVKTYTQEENGLCHNYIRFLTEDVHGNLWIGASNIGENYNYCIFNPIEERFYTLEEYLGRAIPFNLSLTEVFYQNLGSILLVERISSEWWQVYEYDGDKLRHIFDLSPQKQKNISLSALFKSQKYPYTLLSRNWNWRNKEQTPLLLYLNEKGEVVERDSCPIRIVSNIDNQVCVLCEWERIGDKFPSRFKIDDKISAPFYIDTATYLAYRNEKIYAISLKYIKIYSMQGQLLQDISVNLDLFGKDRYVKVLIDRAENIWISNYNRILYKVSVQKQHFQVALHNKQRIRPIRGIVQTPNKNLYTGSVNFFSKKIAHQTEWETQLGGYESINYLGFLLDAEDIWMGTEFSGLIHYHPISHTYHQYLCDTSITSTPMMWKPYKDNFGTIWVGSSKGIFKLDKVKNKIIPFKNYGVFKKLEQSSIYAFYKNKSGTWLCTSSGLYLVDLEKEQILEHYHSEAKGDFYIPTSHIAHLHEDAAGVFWLATKGNGLIKWHPTTKKYQQFTQKNAGLSHNTLYSVYEDDFGNLWLSSDKGLLRFNKQSELIHVYLEENGLPHNEFNTIAHYQAEDGHLYFGSQNGMVYFHPKDFQAEDAQAAFVITSLSKQQKNDDKISLYTAELLKESVIQLKPTDKSVTLKFALLDYQNPKANQYSYKIEGYDKEWKYQSESSILIINDLPYGKYILKLRAKSPNGKNWIDYPQVLYIEVLRPFYLQWWFLFFVVTAFVGAIYGLFRWRIRLLTQRQEELENTVAERTAKIEQDKKIIEEQAADLKVLDELKSRFFANISHELRTPLTLVLGPLSYLLDNLDDMELEQLRKQLTTMERNGKSLLQLIEEILDLAKLDAQKLTLDEEATPVGLFFNRIFAAFEPQFQQLGLSAELQIDAAIADLYILLDRNKIEKVLNNFLGNALKFTPRNGRISLKIIDKSTSIAMVVTDTGKGIHPKDLPYIFERFYQSKQVHAELYGGTGIGLALVQEFAGLMEAKIGVESTLGEGSSFYFELPKKIILPTLAVESLEHQSEEAVEKIIEMVGTDFTILVVEDNEDMRQFICTLLEKRYKVLTAINGLEGLAQLKANQGNIHLIISDVMMPEMDGLTMLKQLKLADEWRGIPVVMLTALAAERDKLNALMMGVDDYLVKPFSVTELLARVQNLLFNYHQRKLWQTISPIDEKNNLNIALEEKSEESESPSISKADLEWLNEVNEYIKNNIDDDFDNINLALKFNVSQRQLERRLKKITGLSPAKFVKEIRLQLARNYMEDGKSLSVTEVAYTFGFKSVQTFSKAFIERFGKHPSEYLF